MIKYPESFDTSCRHKCKQEIDLGSQKVANLNYLVKVCVKNKGTSVDICILTDLETNEANSRYLPSNHDITIGRRSTF